MQVMLTSLTAGSSAAAAIVYLAHKGNAKANWFAMCQQYNNFCERISGSLIGSFIGMALFIMLILLSALVLSRRWTNLCSTTSMILSHACVLCNLTKMYMWDVSSMLCSVFDIQWIGFTSFSLSLIFYAFFILSFYIDTCFIEVGKKCKNALLK